MEGEEDVPSCMVASLPCTDRVVLDLIGLMRQSVDSEYSDNIENVSVSKM